MKNEKKVADTVKKEPKAKKGVSALVAASVARSATANTRHHSASEGGLASTGTNVSYEGATAPGGGGSAGTGYSSGQDATGAGISSNVQEDVTAGNAKTKKGKAKNSK